MRYTSSMKKSCLLLVALPFAFSVMGCANYSSEAEPQAVSKNAGDETPPGNTSGDGSVSQSERDAFLERSKFCKEDDLNRFVGMRATDENISEAVAASNSKTVRVLAPGQAATMDYRTNRLNVLTDEEGVIIQMRCG